MTTTVRLPDRVEQALATYCVATRRTKSQVIVELLEQRLLGTHQEAPPYELAQAAGFIGCVAETARQVGGQSANTKKLVRQLVRQKFRAKHSR